MTPENAHSSLPWESRLAVADFQHLGQVMAYLAGHDARIVIWVATGFPKPHLSVIRWLNEHTADPFAFFGVRLEIVRIDTSRWAPVFTVMERPNDWDRQVQKLVPPGELSDLGKFRRNFWSYYARRMPSAPSLRPGFAGSNVRRWVEHLEVNIVQFLASNTIGIYLSGKQGE